MPLGPGQVGKVPTGAARDVVGVVLRVGRVGIVVRSEDSGNGDGAEHERGEQNYQKASGHGTLFDERLSRSSRPAPYVRAGSSRAKRRRRSRSRSEMHANWGTWSRAPGSLMCTHCVAPSSFTAM